MFDNLRKDQEKLRVLVSGTLPPPTGGMATYYKTLLDSSLSKQVDLFYVQTSSQKRQLSHSGRATFSNLISAISDCGRFSWSIITNHPHIVHIGTAAGLSFIKNIYCILFSKILGVRVLLHPHCSLSVLYNERSNLWQWFFRLAIRSTNGIIGLSKEWLQLCMIVPGCKVYYLPNAIDIKMYELVAKKNLIKIRKEEPCRVLYLGYLGKAKGSFDILLTALDVHSIKNGVLFDLVGEELTPGELALLNEKVINSNLDDIVRIHPPAYGQDKLDFFYSADIFIYPSYHEGMPVAVIEAMACGLPVVASRVGGLPDLIQDDINGLLVEPGKPEQLVFALGKLANDLELRISMGKAGFQLVTKQYAIEQHVTELVGIYYKVLLK